MSELFGILNFGAAGYQITNAHQGQVPFEFCNVFLVGFVGKWFGISLGNDLRRCFIIFNGSFAVDIGKVIGSDQGGKGVHLP